MTARRALITGATGYVGSRLAVRLLDDGWAVAAPVRAGANLTVLDERVEAFELDGSTERVIEIMRQAQPDVVLHLAALFVAEHVPAQVTSLIESNVLYGTQILEAMDACGVRALVDTGTSWQHYEGADYDPVCLYAATKQAFGDIAAYYVNARSFRVETLHLFDTYGPDDPRQKLLFLLRRFAASGERLAMSRGEQLLDLVYIDDVLDAYALAVERVQDPLLPTGVWAVSSGRPLPLKEVVRAWQEATGLHVDVDWGGREYRAREVMKPWAGPSMPGWNARYTLEQGLARMEHEFVEEMHDD